MAANSLEPTLPKLPNELLITTVRNFEWTEDIDELRFLWAKLRLVSQMFKETVEDIFAARDISNPTELLKLLPTAMVKLDDLGRFFSLTPEFFQNKSFVKLTSLQVIVKRNLRILRLGWKVP